MRDRRIEQLSKVRSLRGLSYNQMGDEIGVTGMTVFRWFKKRLLPTHRLVIRAVDEFLAKNQAYLGRSVHRSSQEPERKAPGMDVSREVLEV